MKVSNAFFKTLNGSGSLKAFTDIQFSLTKGGEGCFTLKGWKVMEGEDGLWIAPPSHQDKEGKWWPDVIFDRENDDAQSFKKHINDAVIKLYNDFTSKPVKKEAKQSTKSLDDDPFWEE